MFIIIEGDPVEGFSYVGPFDSHDDAAEMGERRGDRTATPWWVAPLQPTT